jgi:8-oxo-dGTP diphosphatase
MSEQKGPILCVDGIVISDNKILMIKRKKDPFAGTYTLPGGNVDFGETTRDAIVREIKEETGIETKVIATLGMYDDPKRDPRGHYVSMVYICAMAGGKEQIKPDEVEEIKWVPIDDLGKYTIGFDHLKMIKSYLAIIMLGKSKFP